MHKILSYTAPLLFIVSALFSGLVLSDDPPAPALATPPSVSVEFSDTLNGAITGDGQDANAERQRVKR